MAIENIEIKRKNKVLFDLELNNLYNSIKSSELDITFDNEAKNYTIQCNLKKSEEDPTPLQYEKVYKQEDYVNQLYIIRNLIDTFRTDLKNKLDVKFR